MSWWGKLLGGGFGFMLGGPLGAMIGAVLGHQVDVGATRLEEDEDFQPGAQVRLQSAFFAATFSVMGHLAKADGRVSEAEIAHAREVMARMQLQGEQLRIAMDLFNKGKQADFDLSALLQQLKREIGPRRHLAQMFIEIQIDVVMADGELHDAEYQLLRRIALLLGVPAAIVDQLIGLVAGEKVFHESSGATQEHKLAAAYKVLGIEAGADDKSVKNAYRRLMAQHHPDKLVAQGLPQEMMQAATKRVQEIQDAYECIKQVRGLR